MFLNCFYFLRCLSYNVLESIALTHQIACIDCIFSCSCCYCYTFYYELMLTNCILYIHTLPGPVSYSQVLSLPKKFVRTKIRPKEGTKIELQREISQIWLQLACCRLFVGILQAVCRLFAGYLQSGIPISTLPVILCCFHMISVIWKKTRDGPTDGWTDGRTKGRTDRWRNRRTADGQTDRWTDQPTDGETIL